MSAMIEVICPVCQGPFKVWPARLRKVAQPKCSRKCNGTLRGAEWATHAHKGRAAWTESSRASYSTKMSGAKNPAWKGGVTFKRTHGNHKGAKYVRCPPWALAMARKDGYVMEHRLVMARLAGRLLTRTEVVHHVDHDPLHNAPENLEMWPTNRDHKLAEAGRFVPGVANRLRG